MPSSSATLTEWLTFSHGLGGRVAAGEPTDADRADEGGGQVQRGTTADRRRTTPEEARRGAPRRSRRRSRSPGTPSPWLARVDVGRRRHLDDDRCGSRLDGLGALVGRRPDRRDRGRLGGGRLRSGGGLGGGRLRGGRSGLGGRGLRSGRLRGRRPTWQRPAWRRPGSPWRRSAWRRPALAAAGPALVARVDTFAAAAARAAVAALTVAAFAEAARADAAFTVAAVAVAAVAVAALVARPCGRRSLGSGQRAGGRNRGLPARGARGGHRRSEGGSVGDGRGGPVELRLPLALRRDLAGLLLSRPARGSASRGGGGSIALDGLRSLDEEVALVERTHAPDFRWTAFHTHSWGEERDPCKHAVTSS